MAKKTKMYYKASDFDKAIYMHKNYGVEFEEYLEEEKDFVDCDDAGYFVELLADFLCNDKIYGKIYIKKESEPVFSYAGMPFTKSRAGQVFTLGEKVIFMPEIEELESE